MTASVFFPDILH